MNIIFPSPTAEKYNRGKILLLFGKYFGYVYNLSSYLGCDLDLSQICRNREVQFSEEMWSDHMFGMKDRMFIHRTLPGHAFGLIRFHYI